MKDENPAGPHSKEAKPPSASRTTLTELVLPNDANTHGNILGGKVMHLIDLAGAIAAFRHCRRPVVTAAVDSLVFLAPVRVGQLIILEAWVTRAFGTSMEVEAIACSEAPYTGERVPTTTAFLTFVALDDDGKPTTVAQIRPETEQEKQDYEAAQRRRWARLEQVHRL